MKGDRMIWNYFRYSDSPLRRFVESIGAGETLLTREIMERSGLTRSDTNRVLRMLRDRGMVQVRPYRWPVKPSQYEDWGARRQARWRKKVRGDDQGAPGARYCFLGFTVSPVDDVLHLATLDKQGEIGESEG